MTTTFPSSRTTSSSRTWLDAVQADLRQIENKMLAVSRMGQANLDAGVATIITSGGKRIRPAITTLGGRLFSAAWPDVESVAASIELLHTATLVHDDLIDGADSRRGVPTLHSRLPLGITVLTGDFLFAQAAHLAAAANNVRVVSLFAETLVQICKGEILQAQTRFTVPSLAVYEERIYGKTAALFEAAAAAAALLGDADEVQIKAMARYGRELGLAFQVVDDALDFLSTAQKLGKPVGSDMRQGHFNLPVMYYVQDGCIDEAELKRRVEAEEDVEGLLHDIRERGFVQRTLESAARYVENAVTALLDAPSGEATEYLIQLAYQSLERKA